MDESDSIQITTQQREERAQYGYALRDLMEAAAGPPSLDASGGAGAGGVPRRDRETLAQQRANQRLAIANHNAKTDDGRQRLRQVEKKVATSADPPGPGIGELSGEGGMSIVNEYVPGQHGSAEEPSPSQAVPGKEGQEQGARDCSRPQCSYSTAWLLHLVRPNQSSIDFCCRVKSDTGILCKKWGLVDS
jgi:hypothetical protein